MAHNQEVKDAPSFFPTSALDHAVAGTGAGVVAVLCMHPLDLLKIKFQVSTSKPQGGIGRQIYTSLKDIYQSRGVQGLYRGVGPNIAGNASSWGLYFLFAQYTVSYHMLKRHVLGGNTDQSRPLGILLCSAEASAATALLTNPIWVVKVRMFTTNSDTPGSYKGLWHGLREIYRYEGLRGLYRGTWLALFGVSNGALQFMAYEEMKRWAFRRKKRQYIKTNQPWTPEVERLSNTTYTIMSGASKVAALASTYPYQVVRSRLQNNATAHLYPNMRTTIRRTWAQEGFAGFYRGLGTNLVRILPGTCVTFVVYENIAWLLRRSAARRHGTNNTSSIEQVESKREVTVSKYVRKSYGRKGRRLDHSPVIMVEDKRRLSHVTPRTLPAQALDIVIYPKLTIIDGTVQAIIGTTLPIRVFLRYASHDLARNEHIRKEKCSHVYVVNDEGKLSRRLPLSYVLDSIERKTHFLQLVNQEKCIVKILDSRTEYSREKARRKSAQQSKKAQDAKEVQMTWAVDENDFMNKLKDAKTCLLKGSPVDIIFAPKKNTPIPSANGRQAKMDRIIEYLQDIAKEYKERTFEKSVLTMSFKGKGDGS
ncbi:hypothetical protein Clacol_010565 [Clathrus columnatus]|uniref:Mitochondrial folate transporter/carrier n=1 Tax=Clathrus columnatus TaxID=1419009 RepID=A0AAV5AUA3_9AGAM|nr:hypothetical protein Clacol_010565 [Clathrus columnatus]